MLEEYRRISRERADIPSELRGAGGEAPSPRARCPRTLLFLKAGRRPAKRIMSGSQLLLLTLLLAGAIV